MASYIFKTVTTMKEYNRKNWWIDGEIVSDIRVNAESLRAALEKYREAVEGKAYITISDNALKCKSPMYVDTVEGDAKQVGYVITGQAEFEDGHYRWVKQYVDLWVAVLTVVDTEF